MQKNGNKLGRRKLKELAGSNLPVGQCDPPGYPGGQGMIVQQQVTTTVHHGPIPAPAELAEYEKIHAGLADRIMAMAEGQARHRQEMEKTATTATADDVVASRQERKRGQIISGIVVLAGFGAAIALGIWGQSAWAKVLGAAVASIAPAGIIVAFITGKKDGDAIPMPKRPPVKTDPPG